MRTGYFIQAAATQGRAAAESQAAVINANPSAGTAFMRSGKSTKKSSFQQEPTLFDEEGESTAVREEIAVFFERLHELLSDQNPSDRVGLISAAYWVMSGESRETITGILKPRLRAVFASICEQLKV